MRTYEVVISPAAEADLADLAFFLRSVMSLEGARRVHQAMRNEVLSLSVYADCFSTSRYADVRRYHPQARRMVSHNKSWFFIFHIEGDTVVVDRIRQAKLIKQ